MFSSIVKTAEIKILKKKKEKIEKTIKLLEEEKERKIKLKIKKNPIINTLTVPEMLDFVELQIEKKLNPLMSKNHIPLKDISIMLTPFLKPLNLRRSGYDIVSTWNLRKEYFGWVTPYPRHGPPAHNFRKMNFKLCISDIDFIVYLYPKNSNVKWSYAVSLELTNLENNSLPESNPLVHHLFDNPSIIYGKCLLLMHLIDASPSFGIFDANVKALLADKKKKIHCLDPRGRKFKMKQVYDIICKLREYDII